MPSLLHTQRLFNQALQTALFGEDREAAGLETGRQAAPRRFDALARTLLASRTRLTEPERLNLYQRQYWFRLLDSLIEDFPRLEQLLGRKALLTEFERYLRSCPPTDWNLRALGAGLPAFVGKSRRIDGGLRPLARDIARLDYAMTDLAESPLRPYPRPEDIALRPLALQPCVRLLVLRTPVALWLEGRHSQAAANPAGAECHVCWRDREERLRSRTEPNDVWPLLRALAQGGTLAELIGRTRRLASPEAIRDAFERWQRDGLIGLKADVSKL